ncbi:hypothetical protein ONO86_00901 [Micromonospora noduli]|nr:hypothetical protein ONO86_00901 [Micromonospora noduli]
MPTPGTTSIRASMSAKLSLPLARAAATACSAVVPAGSCRPITPVKIRSVAWPRIFGPATLNPTLTTANVMIAARCSRCERSRPSSRRADGPKFIDFSAGIPALIHPGPPP